MALVLKELATSRGVNESRRDGFLELAIDRIYHIVGTDNPEDAATLVTDTPQNGNAHPTIGGLYVVDRKFEVLRPSSGGATNDGAVKLTVTYGPRQRLKTNDNDDPEVEIDVQGDSIHIEVAPVEQAHYPSDINKIGDLIGVDNDGKVAGVDIYVPKGTYTETRILDSFDYSDYNALLFQVGTVNNADWKGFLHGEALFMGASVSRKGLGLWKAKYNFAIQPNIAQSIHYDGDGGTPASFTKPGWHYMWFMVKRKDAGGGEDVEQVITQINVAQVYRETDFSLIGIGS